MMMDICHVIMKSPMHSLSQRFPVRIRTETKKESFMGVYLKQNILKFFNSLDNPEK